MMPAIVYVKRSRRKCRGSPRKQENPVSLQVCQESRTVALKRYESISDFDNTYVNFDLDTVYIDFDWSFTLHDNPFCSRGNEDRFQYLAIDMGWLAEFGIDGVLEKVSRCQSLRQLTLVCGFTTMDRKYKANLSRYLARCKDMTEDELEATVGYNDLTSFDGLYTSVSAVWIIALNKSPRKDKWPEIFITTIPPITRDERSLGGDIGSSS